MLNTIKIKKNPLNDFSEYFSHKHEYCYVTKNDMLHEVLPDILYRTIIGKVRRIFKYLCM